MDFSLKKKIILFKTVSRWTNAHTAIVFFWWCVQYILYYCKLKIHNWFYYSFSFLHFRLWYISTINRGLFNKASRIFNLRNSPYWKVRHVILRGKWHISSFNTDFLLRKIIHNHKIEFRTAQLVIIAKEAWKLDASWEPSIIHNHRLKDSLF